MSAKTELAKNVSTWDDARKIIFDKIYEIIQDAKYTAPPYEIMSYMYLTTKLIMRYHDCHQVFEFDYCDVDKTIQLEKYFTEDFTSEEKMNNSKDFGDRFQRDKPEVKKPTK